MYTTTLFENRVCSLIDIYLGSHFETMEELSSMNTIFFIILLAFIL